MTRRHRRIEIFEAFITTKRKGMRLGLAIRRTIVERHGPDFSIIGRGGRGPLSA